jgi:LAGLIDADG DNA endonuclease family
MNVKSKYIKNISRSYRTSKKVNLTISNNLHEIIIGSFLGDLTAEKPNVKCNTRLQFKQSFINKKYIYHLYSLFKEYCGTKPLNMSRFDRRANKNKTYYAIKFQTLSLPCFNIYK